MYRDQRIAAVIPAHNEAAHIGAVLDALPDTIDYAVVVDDGSTDTTGAEIAAAATRLGDRLQVVTHETNGGVGAARVSGMRQVLERADADIVVSLDGDGQMDVAYLGRLLDPVVDGYDFSKGNRFFTSSSFESMPSHRIFGNIALTFMTKLATGYWSIFDPQNGFTALRVSTLARLDLNTIATGYAYENDLIGRLGLVRARIADVDIPAVYGNEVSGINLDTVVPEISHVLWRTFARRFWLTYVLRSFSPVALFAFFGAPLLLFSLVFGTSVVIGAIGPSEVSAANAVLTSLTFSTGFTLLLAALVIDVLGEPR